MAFWPTRKSSAAVIYWPYWWHHPRLRWPCPGHHLQHLRHHQQPLWLCLWGDHVEGRSNRGSKWYKILFDTICLTKYLRVRKITPINTINLQDTIVWSNLAWFPDWPLEHLVVYHPSASSSPHRNQARTVLAISITNRIAHTHILIRFEWPLNLSPGVLTMLVNQLDSGLKSNHPQNWG